jgi:hypothetical protein
MLAVNGSPLKRAPLAAMVVAIEAAVKTEAPLYLPD